MTGDQVNGEYKDLLNAVTALERENKSLRGLLGSASQQALAAAQKKNSELLAIHERAQKALALEWLARKTPIDTASLFDSFTALKTEVLAYCIERKIEPSLWKKLESL